MTLKDGCAGTLSNLWNCDDAVLESNKNAHHHSTDAVTDVSYEILKYRLVCHQQEFRSVCLADESLQTGEVERLDRGLRTLLDDIRGGLITMTTLRCHLAERWRQILLCRLAEHRTDRRLTQPFVSPSKQPNSHAG